MVKAPYILFFVDGQVPTAQNQLEANALRGKGATVGFRNARMIADDESPETADAVTGAVPESYKKLPSVDAAFEALRLAQEKEVEMYKNRAANPGAQTSFRSEARIPVREPTQPHTPSSQVNPTDAPPPTSPNTTTVGVENLGKPADGAGVPVQVAPGSTVAAPMTFTPAATVATGKSAK